MTDPTAEAFLSYKHEQQKTATLLENALREHGVPVWRDQSNLRSAPLEPELKATIENPDKIASGICLISEEVAESKVILKTELPSFQKRRSADDGFFVVIVRCPDIGVDTAKGILRKSMSLRDFSSWYMPQLEAATPEAAAEIADLVLKHRLEQIHESISNGQPIQCSLDTHEPPAHDPPSAVAMDWSAYFDQRLPSEEEWNQQLLPTARAVTSRLKQQAPGRPLQFRGQAHLPASFALGRCLRETRNIQADWLQPDQSGTPVAWRLDTEEKSSGLTGEYTPQTDSASDLAVLISVSSRVDPEVTRAKPELPEFKGFLEFEPENGPGIHLSPSQASHAATVFRNEVRATVDELPDISKIHLFMAVPTGLAFLFGQQTNTLPPIQTYVFVESTRTYRRAALIQDQQSTDNEKSSSSEDQKTRIHCLWNDLMKRFYR